MRQLLALLRQCSHFSFPVSLVAAIAPLACAAPSDNTAATAPRDSAGVRITTHATITDAPEWRVADDPLFTATSRRRPVGAFLHRRQLFVVDGLAGGAQRLLVHDNTGRLIAEWGGGGDCDFQLLQWAQPYRRDSVVAYDEARHAVSVFDPDGRCARALRLPNWRPTGRTDLFAPGAYGAFSDGAFLSWPYGFAQPGRDDTSEWYVHTFLHVLPDGNAWDTLSTFPLLPRRRNGERIDWIPFAPTAGTAVARASFWFTTGETFEIRSYGALGELTAIVRYAAQRDAVDAEDRDLLTTWHVERTRRAGGDSAAAGVAAEMQARVFPEQKPAISRLLVDADENVWVERYRWPDPRSVPARPEPVKWLVFSPDGELRAQLTLPGNALLQWVGRDEVVLFHFRDDGAIDVAAHALTRS